MWCKFAHFSQTCWLMWKLKLKFEHVNFWTWRWPTIIIQDCGAKLEWIYVFFQPHYSLILECKIWPCETSSAAQRTINPPHIGTKFKWRRWALSFSVKVMVKVDFCQSWEAWHVMAWSIAADTNTLTKLRKYSKVKYIIFARISCCMVVPSSIPILWFILIMSAEVVFVYGLPFPLPHFLYTVVV